MELKQPTILDKLTVSLNQAKLEKDLRIKGRKQLISELEGMVQKVEQLAKPKALILPVTVAPQKNESIQINELAFSSQILKINLEPSSNVFAVIATAGHELEQWVLSIKDILHRFWADQISDEVLAIAVDEAELYIKSVFNLDLVSWMTPGSLDDWPLSEQKNLFQLFRGENEKVGIALTEHFVMRPHKSLSGLVFATTVPFFSCQLCEKIKCKKRRAAYNEQLKEQKYGIQSAETPLEAHRYS